MRRIGIGFALVGCLAGTASPDEYDEYGEVAAAARAVRSDRALAGLVWSHFGACASSSELERLQCEGVRAARQHQLAGQVFSIQGDSAAVEVGAWDPKKKSVSVTVRACVACAEPVVADQVRLYLTGSKPASVSAVGVQVAPARETALAFDTEAAAEQWTATVVPRLRAELIASFAEASAWEVGGVAGVALAVRGWRVYDPCTGKVIAASSAADDLAPDRRTCGDAPTQPAANPAPDEAAGPAAPAEPPRLRELSPFHINQAMAPVRKASYQCLDKYGVAGNAKFSISIDGEGQIVRLEQRGDFADTPTGRCLEDALRAVQFPKTQKKTLTFDFPIVLR